MAKMSKDMINKKINKIDEDEWSELLSSSEDERVRDQNTEQS